MKSASLTDKARMVSAIELERQRGVTLAQALKIVSRQGIYISHATYYTWKKQLQ